jgi:GNAT superfamily N-acetyltransferase
MVSRLEKEHGSVITVRPALPADASELATLLEAFMQDAFRSRWHGTADALRRDGSGAHFETSVALASSGTIVGFVAWEGSYDLHHCVSGGHVIDLYVRPSRRGQGVALALVADVAARVRERGGHYVRGQAIPAPAVQRMYERVAVLFPGAEANVGGRAFHAIADLAGLPAREAARRLPPKAWNYEG